MQESLNPEKKESPSVGKHRDPLVGTTLDGRYYIEEVLGTGGMSVVYKATQLTIDRHVAIKTIKLQVDTKPIYRERFVREIRSLCALSHPNVVTVYDCVIGEDDQPYVVMDYLRGKSLDALIQSDGPLDLERFARICVQVCSALDHAHKKGIVHRDIKPGNIVLMDEEMDFVKVVDFGLAKLGDDGRKLTNSGELWGSPPYISPEQCMGKTGDARSDIYSFGTVMFEMLTGKDPFYDALSVFELIQKHVGSNPPPFVDVNHELVIPGKVQDMVFKAMEKDPERRYQNALSLQQGIIEACSSDIGRESREYLVHMAKQASTRPPGTGSGQQKSGEFQQLAEGAPAAGDQGAYFNNALSDISQSDMRYFAQNTPQSQAPQGIAPTNETTKWSRAAAETFVPSFDDPARKETAQENVAEKSSAIPVSDLDAIPTPTPAPKAVPSPAPAPSSPAPVANSAPPARANLSRQSLDAPPGSMGGYIIAGVLVLAIIVFFIFQQVSSHQKTSSSSGAASNQAVSGENSNGDTNNSSDTTSTTDSDPPEPKSGSGQTQVRSTPKVPTRPARSAPRPVRRAEPQRNAAPVRSAPTAKPAKGGKSDPWSTLEKMRD